MDNNKDLELREAFNLFDSDGDGQVLSIIMIFSLIIFIWALKRGNLFGILITQ